jgi:hypothetical protein
LKTNPWYGLICPPVDLPGSDYRPKPAKPTYSKRLCIYCYQHPAAFPDRRSLGVRPLKKVCEHCHAGLLRGDLLKVLNAHIDREDREKKMDAYMKASQELDQEL